jgi:hypothetical protein
VGGFPDIGNLFVVFVAAGDSEASLSKSGTGTTRTGEEC